MLLAGAKYGYRNIILGAWGCGFFGNYASDMARFFQQVIVEEKYGGYFREICFTIYGDGRKGKDNYEAFKRCF